MRVVAGSAKGRALVAPAGTRTRPTSDRVREAIFNTLYSTVAVDGARVVDLFAGSGALGVEALSRGATHATFVDRDRAAVEAIRANVAAMGFNAQATVLQRDAATFDPGPVEIVFADPPYAFDAWEELLGRLTSDLLVAESDRAIEPAEGWRVLKVKHYGTTVVTLMSPIRSRP